MLSDQELEENYNFGNRVEDKTIFFREWIEKSKISRSRLKSHLSIPYAKGSRHGWDIFPAKEADSPFLIFIHGGYWQSQERENFSFIADSFVEAGCHVGLMSYRLCPEVRVMDCIKDVLNAIRALPDILEKLELSATRYVVSGHSAGGNMAAWASGLSLQAEEHGLPNLARAVGISGIYEVWP
ncbi:MAG: alpha/beta hydrolase, partial [Alphaproteobacteria bacterium]|nr:alpha/beta hydrolase [Alphaproteobacteria bacterium]